MDVPKEIRAWFYNFTRPGSCVQCSISISAVDMNDPNGQTLLFDSEYGPHEWHGSGPSRVAAYARARGLDIYNVTGDTTFEWMDWACKTGRSAAIGAGTQHFQTLAGHDPERGEYYVCNNNSPTRIDTYSTAEFRRLHLASGPWIVILKAPPHAARPQYINWWETQE